MSKQAPALPVAIVEDNAAHLGISYWTVQTHVGRLYKKLHVLSRAQAVAKFRRL